MHVSRWVAITAAIVIAAAPVRAQGNLPFATGWELRDSASVAQVDGREALSITNGFAYRRDVQLQDGTIDVDVKTTTRRSFVYVGFRMQADDEHEEFYLRPHKSSLPDAVQYAPVYQGQSAWQLYHGANGTAAPEITPDTWTHLRIVLQGRQAAFFLGDTVTPVLVVNRLGREPRPGYIALRGFLPAGTPGVGAIAHFSNVHVQPNYVPFTFPESARPQYAAGVVRLWRVSDPFAPGDTVIARPPAELRSRNVVEALPNGIVELHRAIRLPKGMRQAATVARLTLDADRSHVYRMQLGFSDRVTVLLNGQPLFYRDDSYDFVNRRDGLISFDQATVFLPLRAGRNELAVIVADRFGGWGLMGRFTDTTGLRIEP